MEVARVARPFIQPLCSGGTHIPRAVRDAGPKSKSGCGGNPLSPV